MSDFVRDLLPEAGGYYAGQGLTLKGSTSAKWKTTCCHFHGGSDSMRINTVNGAFVCMAGCGARGGDVLAYHMAAHGLDFITAAKALGAWRDDGKPSQRSRPRPLPAIDAIRVLAFEATLTAIAAGNIANGVMLNDTDRARLLIAARRINYISEIFV
jgi:hypothetical protein